MAKLLEKKLLALAEVSKVLPNHPHQSTVWRWCLHGVKGVRLRTVIVGGRRYTTVEYLEQFVARLTTPGTTGSHQDSPLRAEQKADAARRADAKFR